MLYQYHKVVSMNSSIIIVGVILLYITVFILGFVLGRSTKSIKEEHLAVFETKNAFSKHDSNQASIVSIDEKKFVTSISTSALQKRGKELGTNVIVDDDVGTAVSKLILLKKK